MTLRSKDKVNLMKLYYSKGGDVKHILASGDYLDSPDHDPKNPYHYHTSGGKKVVVDEKDYNEHKDKSYFRDVRRAIEQEQSKYPEPEYEVNPNFIRDLRSTYSDSMGYGYQNYRNFQNLLPEGYVFTSEGVVIGPDGTAYVEKGYRQTPRFTYDKSNPLHFSIHAGKPIQRDLTFYPINMDRRLKEPLPVDKVLDVEQAKDKAIEDYISSHNDNKVVKMYSTPYVQTGLPESDESFIAFPKLAGMPLGKNRVTSSKGVRPGYDVEFGSYPTDWQFLNMSGRDNLAQQAEQYSNEHPIDEATFDALVNTYNTLVDRFSYMGIQRMHPKQMWRNPDFDKVVSTKPTRRQAEQNIVLDSDLF